MSQTPQSQPPNKRKHTALFYNNSQERLQLLADFFQSGLENGELCIFITPNSSKKVIQDFRAVNLDVQSHIKDTSFRIFNMLNTYIPDGRFVSNYITSNLITYMDDAKALGYRGIRIAGEMNWLLDNPNANDEAIRYETGINDLPATYPASILCLYPPRDMMAPLVKDMLMQHPSFIYDGKQHTNPYYKVLGTSTGTEAKKTSTSRTKEKTVALQAIKNLLMSVKRRNNPEPT